MQQLTLTGILYPPPSHEVQTGRCEKGLGYQLEEFSPKELDMMVEDLKNLPVWVEHQEDKLVGTVISAKRTHSNAISVTATVNASTKAGKRAIEDIRNRKMVGLSLSHAYDFKPNAGSNIERKIQVALENGQEWRNLCAERGESCIRKELRELSVCATPARSGCHIHEIICASSQHANRPKCGTAQQNPKGINLKPAANRLVGVFNCSTGSDENLRGTPANNMEATPGTEVTPQEAAPTGAAVQQEPNAQPSSARDARGRFAMNAIPEANPGENGAQMEVDTPATEAAQPTSTEGQNVEIPATEGVEGVEIGEAKQMTEAISLANNAVVQMKEQMDKMQQEQVEKQKSMESELATMRAEREAEAKEKEQLKQQAEAQKTKRLGELKAHQEEVYKQLIGTLNTIQADGKTVEFAPSESNVDPIKAAESQTNLMGQAIKTINQLQNQVNSGDQKQNMLKRDLSKVTGALDPFGGAGRVVKVNASNDDPDAPGTKRRVVDYSADQGGNLFVNFKEKNPNALWGDYVKEWKSHNNSSGRIAGTVQANSQLWTERMLDSQETRTSDVPCMQQMQPALFKALCNKNKGRMPSSEEVTGMIENQKKYNMQNSQQRPYYA
jgi:hypothetical protein